jgi:hypothetical protein
MRRVILVVVLGTVWGCAGKVPQPLAVSRPLVEVSQPAVTPTGEALQDAEMLTSTEGRVVAAGPTVVGTRGEGLNVASSVHRIFLAMGISTEVRCAERSPTGRGQVQTQVEILFPRGLTTAQQRQVRQVLSLMRARVTLQ